MERIKWGWYKWNKEVLEGVGGKKEYYEVHDRTNDEFELGKIMEF